MYGVPTGTQGGVHTFQPFPFPYGESWLAYAVEFEMKNRILTIVLIFVFLLGLGVLLYPTISNAINAMTQSRVIESYNAEAQGQTEQQYQQMMDAAAAFNQRLYQKGSFTTLSEEEAKEYDTLLNLRADGVMGYIEIPKIDVYLTIGHTTQEDVLQKMVGHIPGTSLPVEGENVHCVLSAHRGLPSAMLFSNLDLLEVGDTFTVRVLNRTYTYQVDKVTIILPEEQQELNIVPGKNLMTLMTCTPYGVNTHRLLVRAEMINTAQ
ncbi:MAG: class C sortase [Clostridia bacterium]